MPDKTNPGNEKKYDTVNSPGHARPPAGHGADKIAAKEKSKESSEQHIRNQEVKESESQGGVSDSLKGGGR